MASWNTEKELHRSRVTQRGALSCSLMLVVMNPWISWPVSEIHLCLVFTRFGYECVHLIYFQHKLCTSRTVVVHTGIRWGATRKRSLARPGRRWGDSVNRMGGRGICDLAQERDKCWALVNMVVNFDVSLTVHLSIFISVFNQLDAQNFCFTISVFYASTCFEHMCSSSGGQNCITEPLVSSHRLVHKTATYRCDDTRGCVMRF